MDKVEELRKRFHDARHLCYAYAVGTEQPQTRVNDDGEPSGTAGRPIMGQIQSFGLHNVLVVVVRYFGGILLGTGGLTVAYKTAAQDALQQAQIVERAVEVPLHVSFDYLVMNDVMKAVKEARLRVLNPVYGQQCSLDVLCPQASLPALKNRLSNIESVEL